MRTWQQTQVEEWFQELKVCQVSVPSANKSNLSRNIKQIVYNLKTYSPQSRWKQSSFSYPQTSVHIHLEANIDWWGGLVWNAKQDYKEILKVYLETVSPVLIRSLGQSVLSYHKIFDHSKLVQPFFIAQIIFIRSVNECQQ